MILECERVTGSLTVIDGWKENIAISPKPAKKLPTSLGEWPVAAEWNPTAVLPPKDLIFPISAKDRSATTIAFTFAQTIKPGDLFHWAFAYGSNPEGVVDDVQPSLTGLTDDRPN